MPRQFFVTERTHCETCNGNGFVTNREWIPWPFGDDPFTDAGDEAYDAYAKKHGSEELQCGECQGKGAHEQEVTLTEALDALGAFDLDRRRGE